MDWRARCLNCGDALTGPFCARCGQRAVPPHPTIRELVTDAWSELAGWDGKVASTMRSLLRHPGKLTEAFLEGRRSRYVSPVRLYLLCSLVYFLVATAAPNPDIQFSAGVGVGVGADSPTAGEAALTKAMMSGIQTLDAQERRAAEKEIASQPRLFQPMLRALAYDFEGTQRRAIAVLPRALFLLIPALGAILWMVHRRRPYADHLYFAIHLQSFVFVVLTLATLAYFARSVLAITVAQITAAVAIAVYGVIALRTVYGGSWRTAVLKTIAVSVLYVTLWSVTSLAVTLWVSRA